MRRIKMAIDNSMFADSRNLSSLVEKDKVRKKPENSLGTRDRRGKLHAIKEIINNSVDEVREGHGKEIRVTSRYNGEITIDDDGSGLPMGWNEKEQKWNWFLACCVLNGSGKFDSSMYSRALGTNGIGLSAAQFASEYMIVESTYGGKTYKMEFYKGDPVGELKITDAVRTGTGTKITFKMDNEVFYDTDGDYIESKYFIDEFREQAMLIPGLRFVFHDEHLGSSKIIEYENGMADVMNDKLKKPLIEDVQYFESTTRGTDDPVKEPEEYDLRMRVAFSFDTHHNETKVYHNNARLISVGDNKTLNCIRNGAVRAFASYFIETGKFSKSNNITFADIEPILVAYGATDAPGHRTWFEHQTKSSVNNPFIIKSFSDFCQRSFYTFIKAEEASKKLQPVIDTIILLKKKREEKESIDKSIRKALGKGVSFGDYPKGFKDCVLKDPMKRELYLVEGDSALGSVIKARKKDFQAAMPLKGKPINAIKNKISEVLKNEVITGLIRVLGCGVEVQDGSVEGLPEFSLAKLNYGKVIICTDGDIDGDHIKTLLLAFFYRYMPSLIRAGRLYIVESPLFTFNFGKNNVLYAYNDAEAEVIRQRLASGGVKYTVDRSKGLGENTPEWMSATTMNPDTRKLIQITLDENVDDTLRILEATLGDDIDGRKLMLEQRFSIDMPKIDTGALIYGDDSAELLDII